MEFFQYANTVLGIKLFTVNEHEITLLQLLVVPIIVWLVLKLMNLISHLILVRLERRNVGRDAIHLFQRVFYVLTLGLIGITILDFLQVPLTAFAFVSGAIAIGVGFGAQNIINNFISGWILMWERPIKIGDYLEVGDARGTVDSINTRSTLIRRTDGVHMLVPNSFLLENTVVNWTLIDHLIRTTVRVGVAYGSDVRKVAQLIQQAVDENPDILQEPKPSVIFEDFGDSALIFDTYFWVNADGDRDLRKIRSEVRFRIDALFAEHGIVIAFPQRDIHLDGEVKLVRK